MFHLSVSICLSSVSLQLSTFTHSRLSVYLSKRGAICISYLSPLKVPITCHLSLPTFLSEEVYPLPVPSMWLVQRHTALCTQKCPFFSLVLCCYYLEIIANFHERNLIFSFCPGSHKFCRQSCPFMTECLMCIPPAVPVPMASKLSKFTNDTLSFSSS